MALWMYITKKIRIGQTAQQGGKGRRPTPWSRYRVSTPPMATDLCLLHQLPHVATDLCLLHQLPHVGTDLCLLHQLPHVATDLCLLHQLLGKGSRFQTSIHRWIFMTSRRHYDAFTNSYKFWNGHGYCDELCKDHGVTLSSVVILTLRMSFKIFRLLSRASQWYTFGYR
jgi:hypothetical protein